MSFHAELTKERVVQISKFLRGEADALSTDDVRALLGRIYELRADVAKLEVQNEQQLANAQPLPLDPETIAHTSYVARMPCGCVVGAMRIKLPFLLSDLVHVSNWMKDGAILDRVPDQYIKDHFGDRCAAHPLPPVQKRLDL